MVSIELFRPPQEIRELSLLQELERNPIVSQRELSKKFGIALGVTNACLKRMVRRGWVQIKGLNHRKIGYFLTPNGFAEKAKLTFHLISWTMQHYSTLKNIIVEKLLEMQNRGGQRIVFYGVSDEMEIAYVALQGLNLTLIGIVEDDDKLSPRIVLGFKVKPVSRVRELKPDSILITSVSTINAKREKLKTFIDPKEVYIGDIYY